MPDDLSEQQGMASGSAPTQDVAAQAEQPAPAVLVEDDEDVEETPPEETAEFEGLIAQIEARAKASGIQLERTAPEVGLGIRVMIPAGRQNRKVWISSTDDAKRLLRVAFEDLNVMPPYAAVCSYKTQTILAAITGISSAVAIRSTPGRALLGDINIASMQEPRKAFMRYEDVTDGHARSIELVLEPDEVAILDHRRYRQMFALRISGIPFNTLERATAVLEEITDAFFFEVDLKKNAALALTRDLELGRSRHVARTRWARARDTPIGFPKARYDREPMSLYWYGRQARGMPLLEFLAYYQCVEFHFPTYAEAEAQKRVRNVLKDPAFDPAKDADITRIVQILSTRRGVGDERAQLKATMTACVDPDALREFFCDPDQIAFFSKKSDLSARSLPIERAEVDLREAVAERLYDIRCKIVHTKETDGADLLLPFSKEASLLAWDIALMQFVARSVLIASSRIG